MPILIESQMEFLLGWLQQWEEVIELVHLKVEVRDNNLLMVTMVETDLRLKTINISSRMTRPGNLEPRLPLQRLVLPQLVVSHMMSSKEREKQRSQPSELVEKKMLKWPRIKKEQDRWMIKRDREMPETLRLIVGCKNGKRPSKEKNTKLIS